MKTNYNEVIAWHEAGRNSCIKIIQKSLNSARMYDKHEPMRAAWIRNHTKGYVICARQHTRELKDIRCLKNKFDNASAK